MANSRGRINLGSAAQAHVKAAPRFNPPPGWPALPSASWSPPPGWTPDRSWPAAPKGWKFWVDDAGRPVPGPPGTYGATSNRQRLLGCGCLTLVGLVLFGSCLGALGGDDEPATQRTTPSATATATATTATSTAAPTTATTAPTPTASTSAPSASASPTTTAPTPSASPTPATATVTMTATRTVTATTTVSARAVAPAPKPAATSTRLRVKQPTAEAPASAAPLVQKAPASAYYPNCTAAKAAGAAPLHRGDAGYRRGLDRDGDGVACEN